MIMVRKENDRFLVPHFCRYFGWPCCKRHLSTLTWNICNTRVTRKKKYIYIYHGKIESWRNVQLGVFKEKRKGKRCLTDHSFRRREQLEACLTLDQGDKQATDGVVCAALKSKLGYNLCIHVTRRELSVRPVFQLSFAGLLPLPITTNPLELFWENFWCLQPKLVQKVE